MSVMPLANRSAEISAPRIIFSHNIIESTHITKIRAVEPTSRLGQFREKKKKLLKYVHGAYDELENNFCLQKARKDKTKTRRT